MNGTGVLGFIRETEPIGYPADPEQQEFEMHRSTYTWIFLFSSINTAVLYDLLLIESVNVGSAAMEG